VASLPTAPRDGDEVYLVADAGVLWRLRYNVSGSPYHWECVGGSAVLRLIPASESTNSQSYGDLPTGGPEFALPAAGVWDLTLGFSSQNAGSNNANIMSAKLGGAAAADSDAAAVVAVKINQPAYGTRIMRRTITSAAIIRAQYRVDGGTGQFWDRILRVTPVVIG
jgi:hypothetical protein